MAHNFRLTGSFYLSKAGSDANSGTTPNTPWASMANLTTGNTSTVILGTGIYKMPANMPDLSSIGTLLADGTVKILGDANTRMVLAGSGTQYSDIYFDQYAGMTFRNYRDGNQTGFTRCILKILAPFASQPNCMAVAGVQFSDCVCYNLNGSLVSNVVFERCLFINCTLSGNFTLNNSYLDATSSLSVGSVTNCNVDPGCNPAAGQGLNLAGAGFALTGPGFSSALPLFNSVVKEDFTLRAASPHILKGIGPSQYRYANSFYGEFTGGASDPVTLGNFHLRGTGSNTVVPLLAVTDGNQALEVNSQGGLTLVATDTATGLSTFVTGRIPFADVADEMTAMLLKAGLNFDTSYPALESQFNANQPEIYNNNVPDYSNYAPGSAGRNPNRLSYRMRWSTKANPNADLANVSDWVTGASFVEFEWNQKPLWNPASGVGNGEAAFDASLGQPIQCTFYQLQVSLRNNYYR